MPRHIAYFCYPILLLFACSIAIAQDSVAEQPAVKRLTNLPYVENKHRQHERHRLDLSVPVRPDGSKVPLVIWIHGGAFWEGSKDDWHPARKLYDQGFAICSINYRLSNSAPFPAQVQDCKSAIRWLRKHADDYSIDADRIGVWGSSAGGYLAAMVGVTGNTKEFDVGENLDQSSAVQCVIDFYGPTNFLKMNAQAGDLGALDHDHPDSPESLLLGGPIQNHPELAHKADPCTYASKESPPFLIIHGQKDPLVAHGQSVLLADALKSGGASVEFISLPKAGHGDGFGESEHMAAQSFLIKHLDP